MLLLPRRRFGYPCTSPINSQNSKPHMCLVLGLRSGRVCCVRIRASRVFAIVSERTSRELVKSVRSTCGCQRRRSRRAIGLNADLAFLLTGYSCNPTCELGPQIINEDRSIRRRNERCVWVPVGLHVTHTADTALSAAFICRVV